MAELVAVNANLARSSKISLKHFGVLCIITKFKTPTKIRKGIFMNKGNHPLLLVLLIIFLTAQTCYGIENWGAFLGLWKSDEDDVINPIYLDCSSFAFTSFSHDANGWFSLQWMSSFAPSYSLKIWHEDALIWEAAFVAGGAASHSTRINWSQLEGADTVEFEFLAIGLQGDTCVLSGSVDRPTPPVPTMICANLRLTAPLGGMANGFETFYWDALNGAVSYHLNIYDAANSPVLVSMDAGSNLNIPLNVSQAAIGGESPLLVELVAFDAYGNTCTTAYEIAREAAPAQIPPQVEPETTPDCEADPAQANC
jgi:hypothetical protein